MLDMVLPIHAHLAIAFEGFVLPNDIFEPFEKPNPFLRMTIPHPTPLFVDLGQFFNIPKNVHKSNVIKFYF
jgi:hypothetical protein